MDEMDRSSLGKRLLIVEDEYLIAVDLAQVLEELGFAVVGPAGTVETALDLVKNEGVGLDGAVLDVNLRGHRVYPVAQVLVDLGVPFIFTTGYDAEVVPEVFSEMPRCEKPVDIQKLTHLLEEITVRDHTRAMRSDRGAGA